MAVANSEQNGEALHALGAALDVQHSKIQPYARASGAIAYEVLRALDDLFLRDLMKPSGKLTAEEYPLSTHMRETIWSR
ncbi:hypothetical protein FS815_17165 [Agrobacterium vitis]|uniref:hypothetical protein n=1 Tax=Allorhizobium ampelinum TaxID=3025782 RepID=UPI001F3ABF39|nr:hypothetical protein [Allorhizobium ampelinum]MCF1448551.1 hypothetical protein [Allorhizobium ampelinum]